MKQIQRIMTLSLALLMVVGAMSPWISAAALGQQSETRQEQLTTGGTMLSTTSFSSGTDRQTEHVITYKPNTDVQAVVAYGSTLYGRSDLDYVANYVTETGERVVAGINGSFFDLANGIPYGCVITEGVLRTSGNIVSVGFRTDGSAVIGTPGISVSITYPSGGTSDVLYNKAQSATNGIVLYSRDFDETVKSKLEQYYVVLRPETTQLRLGTTQRATVVSVGTELNPEIPEGCFVLSEVLDSAYNSSLATLKALKSGDVLSIQVTADASWTNVAYACGAGDMLVQNGKAEKSFSLDSAGEKADRTALGIKADGSVVLYTVDGRQEDYSVGVTLAELAERMVELGCVTAVNLDGGGSTTMAAVQDGELVTVNQPSDGSQRRCANFIFLIYDIGSIQAEDVTQPVMTGASVILPITTYSTSGIVVPNPDNLSYECSSGSGEGVRYTAGMTEETAVIQISRGELTAECSVPVVAPDSITLSVAGSTEKANDRVFRLEAGATIDFNAAASAAGLSLTAQDTAFTWSCDEEIGTISQDGVFVAMLGDEDADGTITVSNAGVSAAIDIVVNGAEEQVALIAGFELDEQLPSGGIACTQRSYVRYGGASLQLNYSNAAAAYSCNLPLEEQQSRLGLWVYGDGSGASISVDVQQNGRTKQYAFGTLDFTGWRYLRVRLDDGQKTITGFRLTGGAGSGTVYLDQLTATRYVFSDYAAPAIQASVDGSLLHISLTDAESALGAENLGVTCDGETLSFIWVGSTATVELPADGARHKIMIYASDPSGNLSSYGLTVTGTLVNPFADTSGHWAEGVIAYLNREGVLNGSQNTSGQLVYRPDAPMSRQEFLVAVIGALGVEPEAYAEVKLPFADADEIASWALPYCKAAYQLGLLSGSAVNGALYAQPESTITRQEAMAILSRTQQKGYAEDDLSGFTDAADVASWARSDIATMVARGVISGENGRLNPTGPVTRAQVAQILYQMY